MMKLWVKEAQQFGLPKNIQKGLMFLIGLSLQQAESRMEQKTFVEWIRRFSTQLGSKPPYARPTARRVSASENICPLLLEFLCRYVLEPDRPNSSRLITAWQRTPVHRLPDNIWTGLSELAEWDSVMTSLCAEMGKRIAGDLEEAYLVGFVCYDKYVVVDPMCADIMATTSVLCLPPHLRWFEMCVNAPALMSPGSPVEKTLYSLCFTNREDPLCRELMHLSNDLPLCDPNQKHRNVSDAPFPVFCRAAVTAQMDLRNALGEERFKKLRQNLLDQDKAVYPPCTSINDLIHRLQYEVAMSWGYGLLHGKELQYPQGDYTHRACVIHSCLANAVLNPDWNACARGVGKSNKPKAIYAE